MNILSAIVVVTNIGYTAAFDTVTRCPAWVAYDLEPAEVVVANRASVAFSADPRISESDNYDDYCGSGFDRGHLAPAADFNWDAIALRETYYYSNVCPQAPSVNRGRWSKIEAELRTLAASGTVHVVTFPKFSGVRKIGRVSVPRYLVKVAYGYFGARLWVVENTEGAK